jgi:uncharacterized membrane protein YeaQ/YmgE (transglycosylase-associated protein family)
MQPDPDNQPPGAEFAPVAGPLPAVSAARREPWVGPGDVRAAGVLLIGLIVVGAIAGAGWAAWSRTPTRGRVYTAHSIIPDTTEGFISSDGRFVIITVVIGLAAGLIAWSRRAHRGPLMIVSLAAGTVIGALVTDLVGRLLGGGTDSGKLNALLPRLPLQVHATGLLFVEGVLAVGLYTLCAMFVAPDDLGRPTPSDDVGRELAPDPDSRVF